MQIREGDLLAEKKLKDYYTNKNGNLSIEEFVKMIHAGEIDSWMRKHKTTHDPCPPIELIGNPFCFHCVPCQRDCISKVKKYKDHYKVKNKKYYFKDLESGD